MSVTSFETRHCIIGPLHFSHPSNIAFLSIFFLWFLRVVVFLLFLAMRNQFEMLHMNKWKKKIKKKKDSEREREKEAKMVLCQKRFCVRAISQHKQNANTHLFFCRFSVICLRAGVFVYLLDIKLVAITLSARKIV